MYNSYMGVNQYGNQYYQPYGQTFGSYQNNMQQPRPMQTPAPAQPISTYQDVPFSDVRYGTLDEAKAHIVMPGKSVMFIDRTKSEFYVKSANNMGEPSLETFKYSNLEKYSSQPVSTEIDPKEFAKTGDLKNFITFKDLEGKSFATKKDLEGISRQIEQLQKKIEIKDILKGEDKNGK